MKQSGPVVAFGLGPSAPLWRVACLWLTHRALGGAVRAGAMGASELEVSMFLSTDHRSPIPLTRSAQVGRQGATLMTGFL